MPFPSLRPVFTLRVASVPCVVSHQLLVTTRGPAEGLISLRWDCGLCPGCPHASESPCYLQPHLCPRGPDAVGGRLSQGINVP